MQYNWQRRDWPDFRYDLSGLEEKLIQLAEGQGRISGMVKALPEDFQLESLIDVMVAEAMKTSAIEGEHLSREDVLSSLRNQLGLNRFPEKIKDKRARGVARLMVAGRESYAKPLTEKMLFDWHRMVMEPFANLRKGQWRSGPEPMQIISGPVGREVVHFEAPPSSEVPGEMKRFIGWFNQTAPGKERAILHAPVRSAIAHLYFETIHPFEDGNGRVGRALSEKALSQGAGKPVLLSLSAAIAADRQAYYDALKAGQRTNEITPWICYFVHTIFNAQELVTRQIDFTIAKSRFFDRFSARINSRQEKVLNRMFEAGPDGFKGGMSARKYVSIAKVSKATATRDLQELANMGALIMVGRGRNTRYELNIANQ